MRVDDPVAFDPQLALQPQQHHRDEFILVAVVPHHVLPPHLLNVEQAGPGGDVVAQYHEVGVQERVVFRGRGVVECEAVGTVVHANVVYKGLV